jgi:hypothetical protein
MMMRKGITALLALAMAVPVATAPVLSGEAQAQSTWAEREAQRDREYNERRDRRWRDRSEYRDRDYRWRGDQREWDASRSYRSGSYRERRLSRQDQIYRGRDGRYYCRRGDGTTGLVVGAALGGILGGAIGGGDLLGVILGGAGGAVLGREIDRGNVRCR